MVKYNLLSYLLTYQVFEKKYILYFSSFCNIKKIYVLVMIGWDIKINMNNCCMYYIVPRPK